MKTSTQKGFIVPLIIGIVAVLIIAGGAYLAYKNSKGKVYDQGYQVPTSVIPAKAGIQGQTSGSNSSAVSSTTNQPSPVITSITPSSGPIGTIIELKGNNLAGFEGELDAWIKNSKGEKAFLPGIGSVPRADQTIRVKITGQLCKENLSYKGGQCPSYMTIIPGTYKIYTYPWGNMSNSVQFIVTAPTSQVVNHQPSISVISPTSGPIGTNVTMTGSGFAATGNTISFGDWQIPNTSSSNGGTSITFTVPNVALCYSDNGPIACQTYIANSRLPATYNVQVSTRLGVGGISNALTFNVTSSTSRPSITVLYPNGGEVIDLTKPFTVSFKPDGLSNNYPIDLVDHSTSNIGYTIDSLPGVNQDPHPICTGGPTCHSGAYFTDQQIAQSLDKLSITVSVPGFFNVKPGNMFKVSIRDGRGQNIHDESDNYFTISNVPPPPINVLSPSGGENYKVGNTVNIQWSASNLNQQPLSICLFSYDKGCVETISNNIPYTSSSYSWTIDNAVQPGNYKIEVSGSLNNNGTGFMYSNMSNNYFTITN